MDFLTYVPPIVALLSIGYGLVKDDPETALQGTALGLASLVAGLPA